MQPISVLFQLISAGVLFVKGTRWFMRQLMAEMKGSLQTIIGAKVCRRLTAVNQIAAA